MTRNLMFVLLAITLTGCELVEECEVIETDNGFALNCAEVSQNDTSDGTETTPVNDDDTDWELTDCSNDKLQVRYINPANMYNVPLVMPRGTADIPMTVVELTVGVDDLTLTFLSNSTYGNDENAVSPIDYSVDPENHFDNCRLYGPGDDLITSPVPYGRQVQNGHVSISGSWASNFGWFEYNLPACSVGTFVVLCDAMNVAPHNDDPDTWVSQNTWIEVRQDGSRISDDQINYATGLYNEPVEYWFSIE